MKKILILTSSPRKNGNTNALVKEVAAELAAASKDISCEVIDLAEADIKPCLSCRCCQTDWDDVFCMQEDDMTVAGPFGNESLFDKINGCDMLILATPIYSWYCTPPMKALLDRCVYAFNKYYDDVSGTHGGKRGPSLWAGKKLALITTCGYPPEKGADLLEEGLKRYCNHSKLKYVGSIVERNAGYVNEFMDSEKVVRAKAFARRLIDELQTD